MSKFYSKAEEFKEILKSGETPDKLVYKEFVETETRAIREELLQIDFIISTNGIDRTHDVIEQSGWDLKAYKKNPVVLWAHDQSQPPVAKAIPKTLKVDGNKLLATAQFMPAEVSEFSHMIFQMYKLGFMNATSVGFRPTQWSFAEDDNRPYGVNFEKQELLEFSCVPVPANSEALMNAKSLGLNTNPLKSWVENVLDNWDVNGSLATPRSDLEFLYKSLSARTKLLKPIEDIMKKTEETVEKAEEKKVEETVVETKTEEKVEEKTEVVEETKAEESAEVKSTLELEVKFDKDALEMIKGLVKTVDELNARILALESTKTVEEKTVEEVVEKAEEPVVEEKKEEKDEDFIIIFDDSVDKEEDSVNLEEVKELLISALSDLDLDDAVSKALKKKFESQA